MRGVRLYLPYKPVVPRLEVFIRRYQSQRGFTVMESAVVVLVIGIVAVFAAPRIVDAMHEYRLNMAVRQLADLVQKVKMQAVADNRRATLTIDTSNGGIGIITYDAGNNVLSTQYAPLPPGIFFATPANNVAPMAGAPTATAISFPLQAGSTAIFQEDFNSKGFPVVAAGAINALYLTNGRTYRALTLNSVAGLRTFAWQGGSWRDVRR
jgi:prepilin-type N-terminal cleavage/methylation domain-containing protein